MRSLFSRTDYQNGYAALLTTLLTVTVSITVILGLSFFAFQEVTINRAFTKSVASRSISESGIEDATYRILTGKQIAGTEILEVETDATTIMITTSGVTSTIRSEGKKENGQTNLETQITVTTDAINFNYGVQVGDGGLTMDNGAKVVGNVYSNGSIDGGEITGTATVAGGITTSPQFEWPANDADQFFATTNTNRDIAQSFNAPADGALNKVSVFLAKIGSSFSNITLRITRDNSGKPDRNGELAYFTIAPSSVGLTPSWIDISFASPPTLTTGTKYWIVLDYGSGSSVNYWNWRKDTTDGYVGNTGRYANDWNSASATWVNVGGDLSFRVWVGGVTTQIANTILGIEGHANLFVNVDAGGSPCPNTNCIVENPPRENMPISDGIIQDWKNEATAGGEIAGDYLLTSDVNLGPKKITGNLLMTDNNKTLTVIGTIYVQGNITIDNGSTVRCAASYGLNSCVIVSDGWIHVKNNSAFNGSGTAGSFIMLLSTAACDGTVTLPPCDTAHHNSAIDLHNNAIGAIFYASRGLLNLHNNVGISEATAYKVNLNENATVTYDFGLADAKFSSGPTGGYQINYWKETQ